MERFNEGGSVDMVSWMVAKQKIDRKELRDWDASARAWLCLADKVKEEQQNRFWLALDQFDLKMTNRSGLYNAVIEVWKDVLEGLELLIKGSSLELRSINLLLGLSALHLYPDVDVVTKKEPLIHQNDPLVPGILTVGLSRSCANGDAGIRWSLPLAHLQYYGKPIQRTKLVRTEGSRLTLHQFCQVLLGCVIGGWGVDPRQMDIALEWIVELDKNVKNATIGHFNAATVIDAHKSWLSVLGEAAQEYLFSSDFDRRVFKRLIKLGYRKCNFLEKPDRPFFGLGEPEAFLRLPTDIEAKIQVLRTVAESSPFSATDLFIRYRPTPGADFEFATALSRAKRKHNEPYQPTYVRWMNASRLKELRGIPRSDNGDYYYFNMDKKGEKVSIEIIKPLDCEIMRTFKLGGTTAVQWDIPGTAGRLNNFKLWLGDENQAALFNAQDTVSTPRNFNFQLKDLVHAFEQGQPHPGDLLFAFDHAVTAVGTKHMKCLRAMSSMVNLYKMFLGAAIDVKVVEGSLGSRSWVKSSMYNATMHNASVPSRNEIHQHTWDADLNISTDTEKKNPRYHGGFADNMEEYLEEKDRVDEMQRKREMEKVMDMSDPLKYGNTGFEDDITMLLHETRAERLTGVITGDAEILASDNSMPDLPVEDVTGKATISFEQLQVGRRISELLSPFTLTRSESFSCIVLFDSGQYDIPPDKLVDVMAISSNDSLFIAGPMICTPSEQPPSDEIHRVTGNIGQGGIALLISPAEPRIRESTNDTWTLCNHDPWDGKFLDCFSGTSLHLSYTGYNIPLDVGLQGAQDWEIYLLESVISVHERGEWVADLDILRALQSPRLVRHSQSVQSATNLEKAIQARHGSQLKLCERHIPIDGESSNKYQPSDFVALQNWSEFLSRPEEAVILLANYNWQAQLAAAAITVSQGHYAYVIKEDSCCYCVVEAIHDGKTKNPALTVCIA
ncbi:hypothetical protein N7456_005519 [Penicillium angulare]|uniref:Uncharacterized protein n=1 Tax=Penicillium angulare TaxID=116970 RepID=A0A9W9FYP0_9EURO|nr:hypothetical protein N7456_005519 [Penicillium angulare]